MTWVLDLDGVVWLASKRIPGASDAVARLRAAGQPVVFVTNNSNAPVAEVEAKLADHGIDARGGVVTSADAAAQLIEPGERVLVCGGPGAWQAVVERDARPIDGLDEQDVDVVLVGYHREFDYERMRVASTAVRRGARLVATNDDATYPTPSGSIPGNGAILASIVTASGQAPDAIAGKGHRPMADLVRSRFGTEGWVVGDRPDTDGRFARTLGYRFALVLTGVTSEADLPVSPTPDLIAADLAAAVDVATREPGGQG